MLWGSCVWLCISNVVVVHLMAGLQERLTSCNIFCRLFCRKQRRRRRQQECKLIVLVSVDRILSAVSRSHGKVITLFYPTAYSYIVVVAVYDSTAVTNPRKVDINTILVIIIEVIVQAGVFNSLSSSFTYMTIFKTSLSTWSLTMTSVWLCQRPSTLTASSESNKLD